MLILKTIFHIGMFIFMFIIGILNTTNGSIFGAITGWLSCICWAILLIFYDLPEFYKLLVERKDN